MDWFASLKGLEGLALIFGVVRTRTYRAVRPLASAIAQMALRLCLALGLALLLLTPAATAQPSAKVAKPDIPSKFLSPNELSPSLLLPPPPADGSAAALEEIAELHRFEAARTPVRFAQAKRDADVEDVTAIANVLGPDFDLSQHPATARLFTDLRNEESAQVKRAKTYFKRTRPWHADPTLNPCNRSEADKGAYPSGHAAMGYSAAAVLAQLYPEKSQAILARASDYAESRLICGAHYRGDIEGGHVLGVALVAELMTKEAFRSELEAARAELAPRHSAN